VQHGDNELSLQPLGAHSRAAYDTRIGKKQLSSSSSAKLRVSRA